MNYTSRIEIRKIIANHVAESRQIRTAINASSGRERDEAWGRKRSLGARTREYHLALAFLRGMPYRRAEQNSRKFISTFNIAVIVLPQEIRTANLSETKKIIDAWAAEEAPAAAATIVQASACAA